MVRGHGGDRGVALARSVVPLADGSVLVAGEVAGAFELEGRQVSCAERSSLVGRFSAEGAPVFVRCLASRSPQPLLAEAGARLLVASRAAVDAEPAPPGPPSDPGSETRRQESLQLFAFAPDGGPQARIELGADAVVEAIAGLPEGGALLLGRAPGAPGEGLSSFLSRVSAAGEVAPVAGSSPRPERFGLAQTKTALVALEGGEVMLLEATDEGLELAVVPPDGPLRRLPTHAWPRAPGEASRPLAFSAARTGSGVAVAVTVRADQPTPEGGFRGHTRVLVFSADGALRRSTTLGQPEVRFHAYGVAGLPGDRIAVLLMVWGEDRPGRLDLGAAPVEIAAENRAAILVLDEALRPRSAVVVAAAPGSELTLLDLAARGARVWFAGWLQGRVVAGARTFEAPGPSLLIGHFDAP